MNLDLEDAQIRKVIYYCSHCGEDLGGKKRLYCDFCLKITNRKEMDENNAQLNKLRESHTGIQKTV